MASIDALLTLDALIVGDAAAVRATLEACGEPAIASWLARCGYGGSADPVGAYVAAHRTLRSVRDDTDTYVTCPSCGDKAATVVAVQMRRADEGQSSIYRCRGCGRETIRS